VISGLPSLGVALSEEQGMVLETARRFGLDVCAPTAAERDRSGAFPEAELKQLAELGFMGVKVPMEHGGAGLDMVSYALAVAGVSQGCASVGVTMAVCNLTADLLSRFANDEQRERLLAPYLEGKLGAGAFCLSEPHCGSDAGALKTTAVLDGDDYVLNGSKMWITNGAYAGVFIVFALSDAENKSRSVTAFVVEKDTPGLIIGKKEEKMGIRSSNTVEVVFEDCRVPAANVLGEPGTGYRIALSGLDGGRVGIAAQSLGIGEAAFAEGVAYAGEREAFGKKVASFQNSQFVIADSRSELDQGWLLTLRAAAAIDAHGKAPRWSSMAKLWSSETACRVADRMLQLHGGYGYVEDYAIERLYRDARITRIYEGTSEVQRIVIARDVMR
jgi:alkylation response protein AidB-like acyl-CoA dehydrogenase